MQSEIYHQNYQSFYPSEPFTLDHINMRHPVIDIIIKSPGAFDSFLLVYDLHAYIESLKKIKQRNEIMFLSWVLSLHHLKLQKTKGD